METDVEKWSFSFILLLMCLLILLDSVRMAVYDEWTPFHKQILIIFTSCPE